MVTDVTEREDCNPCGRSWTHGTGNGKGKKIKDGGKISISGLEVIADGQNMCLQ